MPVQGIGGLFFRARDPEALADWYRTHLGVGGGCAAEGEAAPPNDFVWQAGGGPTVFAPFKQATDYFAADNQWMLNLRVSGLDTLQDALRAADIAVETRAEWDSSEVGRFARIHDPEGNAIELWEPAAG